MEQTFATNKQILGASIEFCAQDIGDSQSSLINSLLPGLLKGELDVSGKCMDNSVKGIHKTKALFVYTHLTFELTQLMSALLMPFDIPLIAITFQSMYPIQYVLNPLYVYSYEASFGKDIHKTSINNLRKTLNITIAATLILYDHNDNDVTINQSKQCRSKDQGAFCTYIGLEPSICLKERFVNVQDDQDMNKTLNTILKTPRLSFVVVQGSSSLLATFNRRIIFLKKEDNRLGKLYFLNFERKSEKTILNSTRMTTNDFGDENLVSDTIYDLSLIHI